MGQQVKNLSKPKIRAKVKDYTILYIILTISIVLTVNCVDKSILSSRITFIWRYVESETSYKNAFDKQGQVN